MIAAQETAVVVTDGEVSVWLNPDTGAAEEVGAVSSIWSRELADGSVAIQDRTSTPSDALGSGGYSVRVLAPDGEERLNTGGLLVDLLVDDGSSADLLLVQAGPQNSTTEAIDVRTGTTRWTRTGNPVVLVDNRLISWTLGGDLEVVDATTGVARWSTRLYTPGNAQPSPVTDGRRVLTIEKNNGQTNLVARDLDTGSIDWAAPWDPEDGNSLTVLPDGAIVAIGDSAVTALG